MRDLLQRASVVVKTSNIKISRRRLADYVKILHQKACRTCSMIIFLHSTNQIIDLWRCRWRCRRQILNSLMTTGTATTEPKLNNLIGWMIKKSSCCTCGTLFGANFDVVCQMTTWNRNEIYFVVSGARFSKVPRTFRAQKAICKSTTCLFCKAGLFICCKGNKNKNNCKVSCLETPLFWKYKENCVTRNKPEKFRDLRETGPLSDIFTQKVDPRSLKRWAFWSLNPLLLLALSLIPWKTLLILIPRVVIPHPGAVIPDPGAVCDPWSRPFSGFWPLILYTSLRPWYTLLWSAHALHTTAKSFQDVDWTRTVVKCTQMESQRAKRAKLLVLLLLLFLLLMMQIFDPFMAIMVVVSLKLSSRCQRRLTSYL